jgi:four helix bundle protein
VDGYEVEWEYQMAGKNYMDLIAWQKAMSLAEAAYAFSMKLPKEELYGLSAQLRRAAVSVPANIAEGQGRRTPREFRRFLAIAHGSLREVETYALLSQRLRFVESEASTAILALSGEVCRLLTGLSNSLARSASA